MAQIPNTRGNPQASDVAVQQALPYSGTQSREDLQTVLNTSDTDIANLSLERNATLTGGGLITFYGDYVEFTENLVLEFPSKIAGGSPALVNLGSGPYYISDDGNMIYAELDYVVRASGGSVLVFDDATTLPAVSEVAAGKYVFLLALRRDSGDGVKRLYFYNGMALDEGQTARLGASGSGAGNANELLESMKNQFVDGYFQLLTPNIFSLDEDDKFIGSSTGTYNLASKTFDFADFSAQTLISTEMLDSAEFLSNTDSLSEIELSVYWQLSNIDTAATYEVSRNGGNDWQQVSMERVGNTELYRGYHTFTEESTSQVISDHQYYLDSLDLNATTRTELAYGFQASNKSLVKKVKLYFNKTGSPDGNVYVSICSYDGYPGSVLSESNAIPISSISTGFLTVDIPYLYLAQNTQYYIKVRTDASYKTSYNAVTKKLSVGGTNSSGFPYGVVYNSTTSLWAIDTSKRIYYSIEGVNLDLRVKITSSNTANIKKLNGYGIFYDKAIPANVASGSLNVEVFEFSGNSNTYEFTLTKFVPHPDLLKVYDVNTGQVYDYGAFGFNGQKVVFESGQFYQPGETVKLRFIQIEGSAFDTSDLNGLLLATNHLGSTDASIDRSIAGRGIFLRRPDGTLREICIDNSDNLVIYSV